MAHSINAQSELVWISPRQKMPDVCCTCGMFTDKRVRVKHVHLQSAPGAENADVSWIHLIALFLGPIGWLLVAIANSTEDKNKVKTIKHRTKIRISQCPLCAGMESPRVLDSKRMPLRCAFRVHPEFAKRLVEVNAVKKNKENDRWSF